jgi:hypothetical protein
VRKLYDETVEWLKTSRAPTREEREVKYVQLVAQSHQLGQQYAQLMGHRCHALAQRILRHEDELFQFVTVEELSPDNSLVERSIRPLVIILKLPYPNREQSRRSKSSECKGFTGDLGEADGIP